MGMTATLIERQMQGLCGEDMEKWDDRRDRKNWNGVGYDIDCGWSGWAHAI